MCPACKGVNTLRVDKGRETFYCEDCKLFFDNITGRIER